MLSNRRGRMRTPLALAVIRIGDEMGRLDCGEGVEFETHPRVTGAHDAVGHKTGLVAKMTRQAELCPRNRVGARIETVFDIHLMCRRCRNMRADPTPGAAMARLTGHTIGELERPVLPLGRHIVGMAVEADRRRVRRFEAKIAGDALGTFAEQYLIGLGVFIVALPCNELVLQYADPRQRLDRAMTGASRACRNAHVNVFVDERSAMARLNSPK